MRYFSDSFQPLLCAEERDEGWFGLSIASCPRLCSQGMKHGPWAEFLSAKINCMFLGKIPSKIEYNHFSWKGSTMIT